MTIAMGRLWILSGVICTFASTTHFYICIIRDEFIRYRIAVCDAKSKFCDAKLNVIRRKLRCEAILTAPKKCYLYAISVRT